MLGTRYTVDFPGSPSCTQTEVDAPWGKTQRESCSYFDKKVGHGYSAELVVLPDSYLSRPAAELLLGAASGAAHSTDSDIVSKEFTKVGTFPALDVTLFPRKNGYVAFARYILADHALITITADGYKSRNVPSDVSSFLRSTRVSR
jgi:hypothetical protein